MSGNYQRIEQFPGEEEEEEAIEDAEVQEVGSIIDHLPIIRVQAHQIFIFHVIRQLVTNLQIQETC